MPYSTYSGIKELFVPEEQVEETKQEAEELPSVEITKVSISFRKQTSIPRAQLTTLLG